MLSKWMLLTTICILLFNASTTHALDGTDIWEEGGYIDYTVDMQLTFNYDLEINGEQVLSPEQFPSFDVSNADFKTTYIGINGTSQDMIFQESSSNAVIQDELLGGHNIVTGQVDRMSGIDRGDNEPSWYFIDTSNWEKGFETQLIKDFDYEDDTGIHSESIHYKISGESKQNIMINDSVKVVPVWDLDLNYNAEYSISGTPFSDSVSSTYKISKSEGIVLTASFYNIAKVNNEFIGEVDYDVTANYINKVNLVNDGNVSSNDDSIGFTLGVISLTFILIVLQSRKIKLN